MAALATEIYYSYPRVERQTTKGRTWTRRCPRRCEIAQQAKLRPITEIAAAAGLEPDEIEPYGRYKAKVDLVGARPSRAKARREADRRHGDHADEGRRGQDDDVGLAHAGPRPPRQARSRSACARRRSGPSSGSRAARQAAATRRSCPMEDMNLHFTGDIHAIGAANNLLAAMLEAHICTATSSASTRSRSAGAAASTSTTARCATSRSASAARRTAIRARPASTSRPRPR